MMLRRGFTLLEVSLAAVIGSAILFATVGLFGLMERSETLLDRQFHQAREMGTLQIVLRRSLNAMLMAEDNAESMEDTSAETRGDIGEGEVVETEDPAWDMEGNRPRIFLEYDQSPDLREMSMLVPSIPNDPMGVPQRLELTLPRSPIPASLRLPTIGWQAQGIDLEAEQEVYGISGSVRGVFELRPDGSRERFLYNNGMTPSDGERLRNETQTGWTLWWRPIFPDEILKQQLNLPPSQEDFLRSAAEAYPVIRGVKRFRVLAFDNGYRKPVYAARTATDLPAYMEVEIETYSGLYSNWMFEVGWVNGPDPTITPADPEDPEAETPDGAGAPAGNTGGLGGGGGGGTGGGTQRDRGGRPQTVDRPQNDRQRGGRPGGGGGR